MSKQVMPLGTNKNTVKAVAALTEVKPKRLQMNIHPDFHQLFDDVTHAEREEMSGVVLRLVAEWLEKRGKEIDPVWLLPPKFWQK